MADKKKPVIGEGLKEAAQVAGDFVLGVGDALVGVVKAANPQAQVAYYYLSQNNPTGAFYPGVPLCDLHTSQIEQMPKWIQDSIAGSPMYKSATPAKGESKKE